jgi:transaldolase
VADGKVPISEAVLIRHSADVTSNPAIRLKSALDEAFKECLNAIEVAQSVTYEDNRLLLPVAREKFEESA